MWTESFSRLGWGDLASSQIKHKIWSVAASKRKEYMQKTHALWEGLGQLRVWGTADHCGWPGVQEVGPGSAVLMASPFCHFIQDTNSREFY